MLEAACAGEVSLTTAESCTGGLLASLLTDVEGVSHVFERGFVVYSPQAKCDLLNLDSQMLDNCGAVSVATARAMAEGALRASPADLSLAITGYAGDGEEPGLVYFACARRGARLWEREEHFGDIGRGPVRVACLRVALELMEQALA